MLAGVVGLEGVELVNRDGDDVLLRVEQCALPCLAHVLARTRAPADHALAVAHEERELAPVLAVQCGDLAVVLGVVGEYLPTHARSKPCLFQFHLVQLEHFLLDVFVTSQGTDEFFVAFIAFIISIILFLCVGFDFVCKYFTSINFTSKDICLSNLI